MNVYFQNMILSIVNCAYAKLTKLTSCLHASTAVKLAMHAGNWSPNVGICLYTHYKCGSECGSEN